jgi:chromosome segregation ATPase
VADELDGGAAPMERWDARLGRLEIRLEMLETGIRTEVERIKLVAENIEGISSEFQGTVGGTRSLLDLVNDIGDRLSMLHRIEATVSASSSAVAEQVRGHLEETAPLLQRFNSQLAELAGRFDAVGEHIDAVAGQLGQVGTRVEQLDEVVRDAKPDLSPIATALNSFAAGVDARLNEVHGVITQLRAEQPDPAEPVASLSAKLDELAAAIDEVKQEVAQPRGPDSTALIAPLAERIDLLTAALNEVKSAAPADDVAASLSTRLSAIDAATQSTNAALSEIQTTTTIAANQVQHVEALLSALQGAPDAPDQVLAPVIDRLATVLDGMSSVHSTLGELASAVGALRADRTAEHPSADRVDEQLQTLSAAISDLRANRPEVTSSLQVLAGIMESVQQDAARTTRQLDEIAATVGLASNPTDVWAALQPITAVVEALQRDAARTNAQLEKLTTVVDLSTKPPPPAPPRPAPPPVDLSEANARFDEVLSSLALTADRVGAVNQAQQAQAAAINERLDGVVAELRRTRAELEDLQNAQAHAQSYTYSRPEPRGEDLGGAGAALVASAASAMARLEARMENEFDTVERQTEALGSLVAQSIEAIERVEQQIVGVQPVTEKMRAAVARTLESLRTSRTRGGPPQLNR